MILNALKCLNETSETSIIFLLKPKICLDFSFKIHYNNKHKAKISEKRT